MILLGFLEREITHLLELHQLAPGSSLGPATDKLRWRPREAWVSDYAVPNPVPHTADLLLRNVAQARPTLQVLETTERKTQDPRPGGNHADTYLNNCRVEKHCSIEKRRQKAHRLRWIEFTSQNIQD